MADDQEFTQTPLVERRIVTFALIAYNQQNYIREAVMGAFTQTHESLEIILSDDCSSDKTGEIMGEMAAKYQGKHRVIFRKNQSNIGLIKHINLVVGIASGDTIIFAAGDDISAPNRSEKIAKCFSDNSHAMLVHSQVVRTDRKGNEQGVQNPPITDSNPSLTSIAISTSIYIGATGAIRRDIYDVFGPISETETYEDLTFGFRAALLGGLIYMPEPLVKYRENIGISSQFKQGNKTRKQRRIASIRHRIATLKQRTLDLACVSLPDKCNISREIDRHSFREHARLSFYMAPSKLITGLFSNNMYYHIKAISAELKFLMKFID